MKKKRSIIIIFFCIMVTAFILFATTNPIYNLLIQCKTMTEVAEFFKDLNSDDVWITKSNNDLYIKTYKNSEELNSYIPNDIKKKIASILENDKRTGFRFFNIDYENDGCFFWKSSGREYARGVVYRYGEELPSTQYLIDLRHIYGKWYYVKVK